MAPSDRTVDAVTCTLLVSAFVILACNSAFWRTFVAATGGLQLIHVPLYAATFVILAAVVNAFLTLLGSPLLLKPVLVLALCASALTAYFTGSYGVLVDPGMVQNVLQTDPREALELANWRMLPYFLILGALPSAAVLSARIERPPFWRGLVSRVCVIAASLAVAVALLFIGFKHYAPAFREHRELRYLYTPFNLVDSTSRYLRRSAGASVVAPLGADAIKGPVWTGSPRRSVTLIVVGETARAMNFSLNGYGRETNPRLEHRRGLVNFTRVSSCGTATAVSVPCVFSALGRARYSDSRARSQEGLLDVLKHAGFQVHWRDNNSGCKGTCARVAYEDVTASAADDPLCDREECYDEKLLQGLPALVRGSSGDLVIVLHQLGSHGPSYWKRYPPAFGKWDPVCRTADLAKCPTQDIVAAYDNTILYTDYVLDSAIELLRGLGSREGLDTAFLYFSDHGESLGEKNIYLHGAPYFMAPPEQTRVPMMVWMSDGFRSRFGIDTTCLSARADEPISHDYVFHSVLGMLGVSTAVYDPALDLFQGCKKATLPRMAGPGRGPVRPGGA